MMFDLHSKLPSKRRQNILGVPVSADPYSAIESSVLDWINGNECHTLMTMSFPMLGEYAQNAAYRAAIQASDVVLPDGMAVVWLSRICRKKIKRRLSGPDFFCRFSATASRHRLNYCLLGSTPEVLQSMKNRLKTEYPGITVSATISPPFGAWSSDIDDDLVEEVNKSRAHVLWIGITAPRQETWLNDQKNRLQIPVAAAIGAGFDFFAKTRKRAPSWMQRVGLEWFYRVLKEPGRMLPRYLCSLPAVAKLAFQHIRICRERKKTK